MQMMHLKHYSWLIGLFGLAIWQLPKIEQWPTAVQTLLPFSPYVISALGIFISFFLNRLQPILLLSSLVMLNVALQYFLPAGSAGLTADSLFPLLSILLPINLILWNSLPERGVHNYAYTSILMIVLLSQAYWVFWLMENLPLNYWVWLMKPSGIQGVELTMVPLVVSIIIWFMLVARNALLSQPKVLDKTIVFVLVLMVVALNEMSQFGSVAWLTSIAALMILLSLVFDAHHIAYTDQLTGLPGRRALLESFLGLGRKYTIAMSDIDHFKTFNDRYGHDVGDSVLRTVAQTLAQTSVGRVYRFGGEEFTLVFSGKSAEQAKPLLETLRQAIETYPLKVISDGKETEVQVTVSFGVAEKTSAFKKPDEVMKAADEALYQAKKNGRNRVEVYGEKSTEKPSKITRPGHKSTSKRAK